MGRRSRPVKELGSHAFRASRVFEYLHIDTTFILTEKQGSLRVAFVKDNKSKALLHKAIVPDGKSNYIRDLLKDTFQMYGLQRSTQPINIVSDGGPENKGEVIKWVDRFKKDKVLKLTAKEDFEYSNNMVESLNHIFKNEFLRERVIQDEFSLKKHLEAFDEYYNWNRYPIELYGYAPMEVVKGKVPDKHRFAYRIKRAQKKRYIINKSTTYCGICR
ncbi:MAG: hypothetical protein ACLQQ4_08285 [Bacteroidia bacterium]